MCDRNEAEIGVVFFRRIFPWEMIKVPIVVDQHGNQLFDIEDSGPGWPKVAIFRSGRPASLAMREDLESRGCVVVDDVTPLGSTNGFEEERWS